MVMLASYESSQHYAGVVAIVAVEIGISPKMQRVEVVMNRYWASAALGLQHRVC